MSQISSDADLTEVLLVGKRQQLLLIVFVSFYLVALGSQLLPEMLFFIEILLRLALWAGMVTAMVLLAGRLYSNGFTALFALLTLVPVVNFIALFIVNQKATAFIKEAGFDVGLGGANLDIIRKAITEAGDV